MARVVFTPNLRRLVDCPDVEADGRTISAVLEAVFNERNQLQSYVLDEQGRLRTHMAIFVDGQPMKDKTSLSDPVDDNSEIYIMQALSGG